MKKKLENSYEKIAIFWNLDFLRKVFITLLGCDLFGRLSSHRNFLSNPKSLVLKPEPITKGNEI